MGPVSAGNSVLERMSMRYSVSMRNAATGQWTEPQVVHGNTQLINLFPCPSFAIDQFVIVGPGHDCWIIRGRTDGSVRNAQVEAYLGLSALNVDDVLNVKDDGMPEPDIRL